MSLPGRPKPREPEPSCHSLAQSLCCQPLVRHRRVGIQCSKLNSYVSRPIPLQCPCSASGRYKHVTIVPVIEQNAPKHNCLPQSLTSSHKHWITAVIRDRGMRTRRQNCRQCFPVPPANPVACVQAFACTAAGPQQLGRATTRSLIVTAATAALTAATAAVVAAPSRPPAAATVTSVTLMRLLLFVAL